MRQRRVWKKLRSVEALQKHQIKAILIAAFVVWALLVIDHVGTGRRSGLVVALFGPVVALWLFRILGVIFVGLAVWSVWFERRQDRQLKRQLEDDTTSTIAFGGTSDCDFLYQNRHRLLIRHSGLDKALLGRTPIIDHDASYDLQRGRASDYRALPFVVTSSDAPPSSFALRYLIGIDSPLAGPKPNPDLRLGRFCLATAFPFSIC